MNAIGIICEYNPFHLGHARMLKGLRRQYDAPLVCAMSGNFVQRGDAAVAHKHARGEMAVRCGADLVLELPTPWAMASAERFAAGGVALLASTGVVSHLAFGSECGDLTALQAAEAALSQPELMPRIRQLLAQGMSGVQQEMKDAVASGYWNLYRYSPETKTFTLDSKEPTMPLYDFMKGEVRYASLELSFPDNAKVLFAEAEEAAQEKYESYRRKAEK